MRLKRESERTGLGLAELVRRALASAYSEIGGEEAAEALVTSFAAWQDREVDGAGYVDRLRPGIARRLNR